MARKSPFSYELGYAKEDNLLEEGVDIDAVTMENDGDFAASEEFEDSSLAALIGDGLEVW